MRLISALFPATYALVGLIQAAALFTALQDGLGWPWALAGVAGLVLGGLPVIGTLAGSWAAVGAWGWSWGTAAALFAGPPALAFLAVLFTHVVTKKTNPY